MLYSMTGYGKAEGNLTENKLVSIELKSLNGKNFDFNHYRFPAAFRAFEMNIKDLLQKRLFRGSIEVTINLKKFDNDSSISVNHDLAVYYFKELKKIAEQLALEKTDDSAILSTLLKLPEVVSAEIEELDESDWDNLAVLFNQAIDELIVFRQKEGAALEAYLLERINNIELLLNKINPLEQERMERIKSRIADGLEEWSAKSKALVDENRFEQELIYYLEKIDFSEEKLRLATHCKHFTQVVKDAGAEGAGKKLGFILQEVGREINTLGSKANDSEIQKIVVNMKDELEKAKEQTLNVL